MSEVINIRLIQPGSKVRLADGSTGEVITNFQDGVWISVTYLTSPNDPSLEGTEEMVFAQDIVELLETP